MSQPASRAPGVMLLTLGCSKNTVDSEHALGELAEAGFAICLSPEEADLVLINTCGFIDEAREEARTAISRMLSCKGPDGFPKVAAMGCLAQREGAALRKEFPELDAVLGLGAYGKLTKHCLSLLKGKKIADGFGKKREIPEGSRLLSTPPSYAYLRIADGCDNRCSYCAIPLIRGRFQSREMSSILDEAKSLCQGGVRELVLVAQDTTLYGMDRYGTPSLDRLLREILALKLPARIRIMYAHPAHLNEEVLRIIGSEEKVCSYLDLPIQHINDRLLQSMNRHYGRDRIEQILEQKEKYCPQAVLRTSIITGFPGETEENFSELLDFVKAGHFHCLGAFAYSREDQTPSAKMEAQIPVSEARRRRDAIMQAQQPVSFRWLDSRLGSKVEVLVDGYVEEDERILACRSEFEAPEVDGFILLKRLVTETGNKFLPGGTITACLQKRNGYDIEAETATS